MMKRQQRKDEQCIVQELQETTAHINKPLDPCQEQDYEVGKQIWQQRLRTRKEPTPKEHTTKTNDTLLVMCFDKQFCTCPAQNNDEKDATANTKTTSVIKSMTHTHTKNNRRNIRSKPDNVEKSTTQKRTVHLSRKLRTWITQVPYYKRNRSDNIGESGCGLLTES